MDVSRKLILDKTQNLFGKQATEESDEVVAPKFIQHIETGTIEWTDSKLTFAIVIARSSPIIKFLLFKHSENKLFHLYSMNTQTEFDESNPE